MNGHGYIYFWRIFSDSGFIKVCNTQAPPGSTQITFFGEDVIDQSLRDELAERNINTKAECTSNGFNIRVRFEFGLGSTGESIAEEVEKF